MVYPDSFTVSYNYGSGLDDSISRLTSMTNSSTTLESYTYLGLGTVVQRAHPESGVDLTYIGTSNGEAGDKYVGLDRFGRVIDQRWVNGSGTDKDRFKYGYDEDSNRLYRTNELNHSFDELYHANGASYGYDGLNQLSDFRRGTLSDSNSDMIPDTVTTASRTQNWDPDGLGNFENVTTDGTGTSRTHNKQNQLTAVGANSLTFDNNGNTTTDETGRTITYDAWNRLVKINSTTRYANDALGRRIKEGSNDLYYSTSWQVLEEYGGANPTARYVWSPVYVDAMVLRNYAVTKNGGLTERLYVAQDANWNVTALINTSGSVVERYVYDPYGRFDVKDASWGTRSSSSYAWVYLHQGGRWDATAALFNFRHRDYSPALMRWVSVDPVRFKARDVDFYRYEINAPDSKLDPRGLEPPNELLPPGLRGGSIFEPPPNQNPWQPPFIGPPPFPLAPLIPPAPPPLPAPSYPNWYGQYCGPWNAPPGTPPDDPIDAACLGHDNCYRIAGNAGVWGAIIGGLTGCAYRYCDLVLCMRLSSASCVGSKNGFFDCERHRLAMIALFCTNSTRLLPGPLG